MDSTQITMRMKMKSYLPALACAMIPIICYLVARPFAEMGIDDDWSYVKTAQVFAQTGHISYYGGVSPMLGWHACLGALFIKLFGFSFTVARLATLLEAAALAFIAQRTFVRAGLNAWNGTLATMAFILSPLFLPISFTFMSDVAGVLTVVVCLYMCFRTHDAETEGSAIAWITLAALSSAVGGTARQFGWLGVLVMVPSTLWLVRRKRRVIAVGCLSLLAGVAIVATAMHWFAMQPHSIPESPLPRGMDPNSLKVMAETAVRYAADLALLSIPVLLMFVGSMRTLSRRMAGLFAAVFLCVVLSVILLLQAGRMHHSLPPFVVNVMTNSTFDALNGTVAQTIHLAIPIFGLPLLLTAAIIAGILGVAAQLFVGAHGPSETRRSPDPISWRKLGVLLGPFCAAYIFLLASIALRRDIFNRYLLPLLLVLFLVLACYYQQKVRRKLPLACVFLIAIFGGFSVGAAHDDFALYRGYVHAIGEIRASGVPATFILGPIEFTQWTQVESTGYVKDSTVPFPPKTSLPGPERVFPDSCREDWFLEWVSSLRLTPEIKPVYTISSDPRLCGGQIVLSPVTFHTWIPPRTIRIYDLKLPDSFRH